MKKLLALFLAAMILCAIPASAERFTLRGGITWGMEVGEVIAIAGVPDEEYGTEDSQLYYLCYYEVPVSKYTATLVYCFCHGELVLAQYRIDDLGSQIQNAHNYLKNALISVYGADVDFKENKSVLDRAMDCMVILNAGDPIRSEVQQCRFWQDKAKIWEFIWDEDDLVVLYGNRGFDPAKDIVYAVEGL